MIEAARAKLKPVDTSFYVFEENWPTVSLFQDLATDWRMAIGMAGVAYFGLDKGAVEATMNMLLIRRSERPELLRGLKVMEAAALPLLNKNN